MQMPKVIIKFFLVQVFLCAHLFAWAAPQEEKKLTADSIKEAFEKAIKDVDAQKAAQEKELAQELKVKLDFALKEWVSHARQEKAPEMNKLTHQKWEGMSKFISPVPYDYYLRDYNYIVSNSDIVKTDSLMTPYRANAQVLEKLYIERYHPSNSSDIKEYLDVVSRSIRITFEYRDGKFAVTDALPGEISIERGWPQNQ